MTDRWTWHGGGLAAACARFGGGEADWLDLSTGINPHAWPGAAEVPVDWRRLPGEQALRELESAAAACFGCLPDHLCAVPGTEVGLRLAGGLLRGNAFHLAPAYRTHAEMLPRSLPITADRLAEADGSTLILANPNNPDGRLLERQAMLDLLARRGPDGWLVVDEAFADCDPRHSLARDVTDAGRLVIFRSFGKFFGLAGVRLGFVIGPRNLIGPLRQRLGAWPVSAAALAIGTAAYRDTGWITAMRRRLRQEGRAFDAMLHASGFRPQGACPLFRLIDCDAAMPLFQRLARHRILTRPFDYNARWLRLGLPGSARMLSRLRNGLDHG